MSQDREVSLETERLEEVIDTPPPAQPVVVIQYRSRGIPTYIAIPLLALVAMGSVAFYHRLYSRTRNVPWDQPSVPASAESPRQNGETPGISDEDLAKGLAGLPPLTPVTIDVPTPLALNSQPINLGQPIWLPNTPVAASPSDVKPPPFPPASKTHVDPLPAAPSPIGAAPVATPPPPNPMPPVAAPDGPEKGPDGGTNGRPQLGGALAVGFNIPRDRRQPSADPLDPKPASAPPSAPDAGASSPDEPPIPDPDPPGTPEPDSVNPPLPEKGELMEEIAREAAQKKSQLKQLRDVKVRAGAEVFAESVRRVEEERVTFRRELAAIVKVGGKTAGEEIDNLCQRYGRHYDSVLRARVAYVLTHSSGRISKEARVRQLRGYGVPESGILDYLANALHHYINSRNGPRDSNEVRVRAAKQLLGIKLSSDRRQASGSPRPQGGQAALADPPGSTAIPRAQ